MSTKTFRTRQAPSPTGYLHLGTARTVLFTKLISVINNGVWYLRVDDTDRNRLQPGAVTNLLQALNELGLNADEGVTLNKPSPDKGSPRSGRGLLQNSDEISENEGYNEFYNVYQNGEFGPYIQSERVALYQEHAQKLIDLKLAYWSYITAEEKEELVQIKNVTKKPINYLKENLERHPEKQESLYQSVEEGLKDDQKPVLLYKIQRDEKIKCYDELLGESQFDLNLEEDFAILKSDGYPTYHLAHLIDDFLMQTSLVIRAQEWFPSMPKHVTMFRDYWGNNNVIARFAVQSPGVDRTLNSKNGQNVPSYLHLPFILGEIGNKKMSKRDGNVNMQDYLDKGFLPEAIVNYLAFLGWNPGTDKELYLQKEDFLNLTQNERLEKLISNISLDFSLETLSKSPARFNLQKLEWFNKEYLKMLSLEEFAYRSFKNKIKRSLENQNVVAAKLTSHSQSDNVIASTAVQSPGVVGADTTSLTEESLPYRVGDYAFLVDLQKQKIFCTKSNQTEKNFGGFHYLIGGGRKTGESPIENLTREVDEETYGKIKIEPNKVKYITTFSVEKHFEYPGEGFYAGRELNIYFYETKFEDLEAYELDDIDKYWVEWVDIAEFVENNDMLSYPIWRAFCQENNLPIFEPTANIQKQYLAWNLDKNRITTLSEFGIDSDCILNYSKPNLEIVKWKKSSVEESLGNLAEIKGVISSLYSEYQVQQNELYEFIFNPDFQEKFNLATNFWETEIKKWLTENQKQVGDYLWPLRICLSGKEKSPSPFELLSILKKEEVSGRIEGII